MSVLGRWSAPLGRYAWLALSLACTGGVTDTSDATDETDLPVDTDTDTGVETPDLWSHEHGLYEVPFELVLTPPRDGTEVRYTLDGRDPVGLAGSVYDGPIAIDSTAVVRVAVVEGDEVIVPAQTRSYLFLADVGTQRASAEWPSAWWSDFAAGPYVADYDMDPDVVDDPTYASAFPGVFEAAPIISLVLPPEDLFGAEGIHEFPLMQGREWERVTSLEILDATGELDENVTCGLRIHGGAGRDPRFSPKKSFRLAFRGSYGTGKLKAPLYPEADYAAFDTLVLRAGYNRTWVHPLAIQRDRAQYLRERYVADLFRDMGHPASHVRLSHLFLNGLYWGVYQIEERPDSAWMSEYWGGDEEDYDSLNSGVVNEGDDVEWKALFATARSGVETAEGYAALEAQLEMDAFIDYMLLQISLGNADWPHKNYWAGRKREAGAKWRFFVWDSELTMPALKTSYVNVDDEGSPGELFQLARENPEFVVRFGDAVHREFFNDGLLSAQALMARWDALSPIAYPTILGESARWGDHMRDVRDVRDADLYTYNDHWLVENARARDEFLAVRPAWVLRDFARKGLYPTVAAPSLSPFGGAIEVGGALELVADEGTIYLTLDGTDPRLAGGAIAPQAVVSDGQVRLDGSAIVSARALLRGQWSALVRAEFVSR